MTETILHAEKLGYQTGRRYLLRDINWEVCQGQHWVIFGLNGSGKTTLLSMLAGFKKPTHGQLTILGQAYDLHNVLSLRQRIGWVSSSFFDQYYTKESALQIVLSGLFGTFGLTHTLRDEQVIFAQKLLRCLNLADKQDQPFHTLSKGERQNVLIARALISAPDILLLDEPCTGLDVLARETLFAILRELVAASKVTLIYVTHYTEDILDLFEHCLLLKQGRIYAQGLTQAMLTPKRLSAFLDCPVDVRHHEGQTQLKVQVSTNFHALLQEQEAKR